MEIPHIPVLRNEVVDIFKDLQGLLIDCTLGFAGHSSAILSANENIRIFACDKDNEALDFSKKRVETFKNRIKIFKSGFSNFLPFLETNENLNLSNVVGILADIGVSSLQIDNNDRGFSLKSDALDMRMDKNASLDAKFVVNHYSKSDLERIFYEFAELTNAKQIAAKIANYRADKEITSAKELAKIIGTSNFKNRSISTATLAFQAIRIEVNKELDELNKLLDSIENSAIQNAKIAIITFHSLEDKIVKNRFKKWAQSCICPPFFERCECGNNHAIGKILTKKPITASADELKQNSRAKSAKLRVFEIKR